MAKSTTLIALNNTGSTIIGGTVVYVSGYDEEASKSTIGIADNRFNSTMPAIGVAREDILDGEDGNIRITGQVIGFDTTNASINADVFVGESGGITFINPLDSDSDDNISQHIGTVTTIEDYPHGQLNLFPLEIRKKVKHSELADVTSNQHHVELHKNQHSSGSSDELNHKSLAGLRLDTHKQYSLVSGNRAFTSTVSGVTPTSSSHLTTKQYVDAQATGAEFRSPVLDKDLVTPPGSPSLNDRYIVAGAGGTATGLWTSHEGKITEWNGSSWDFIIPAEGYYLWVSDEDKTYGRTASHPAGSWATGAGGLPGGTDGQIQYNNSSSFGGASQLYYDDINDKVGIGIATPDCLLHIHESSAGAVSAVTNAVVAIETSDSNSFLQFLSPNNSTSGIVFGFTADNDAGVIKYSHTSDMMSLWTDSLQRLSIIRSGHVGINTAVPDAMLHVYLGNSGASDFGSALIVEQGADCNISILTPSADTGSIFFAAPAGNRNGRLSYDHAADNMEFWTSGTKNVIIDAAGNLQIEGALSLNEITVPSATVGYGKVYVNSADSKLYFIDGVGAIFDLTASAGDVVKVGTPANNQLGVWTGDGTIEGDANLVWDTASLIINGDINVAGNLTNRDLTETFETIRVALDGYTTTSDLTVSEHYTQHSEAIQAIIKDLDGYSASNFASDQTISEHYTQHSEAIQAILKDLDGYGGGGGDVVKVGTPANNQLGIWTGDGTLEGDANLTWDGSSIVVDGDINVAGNLINRDLTETFEIIRTALDGYTAASGFASDKTVSEHYTQHSEAIQAILKDLDGYSSAANFASDQTVSEHYTQHSEAIQTILKDLDGYGVGGGDVVKVGTPVNNEIGVWTGDGTLEGDTNLLWDGSSVIVDGNINVAGDIVNRDLTETFETIRIALDGYTNAVSFASDQTVSEHYTQHSEAIQSILKDLDGYSAANFASDQTISEHYTQHSEAIQTILKDLDGYSAGAGDVVKVGTPVDNEIGIWTGDGTLEGNTDLLWDGSSLVVDGNINVAGNLINRDLTETFETIRIAIDGYGTGDGDVTKVGTPANNQLGIWTGSGTLEGDTDLTWDATDLVVIGNIGIGTSSPDTPLHVFSGSAGSVSADVNAAITLENSTTNYLQFLNTATTTAGVLFGDVNDIDVGRILYDHSANEMALWVNTSEAMIINSDGKVGLGIDPAAIELYVFKSQDASTIIQCRNDNDSTSSSSLIIARDSGNLALVEAYPSLATGTRFGMSKSNTTGFRGNSVGPLLVGTTISSALHFGTNDTLAMTIDISQNVGIGTQGVHEKLTVNGFISLQEQDVYDRTHDGYGSIWAKSDGTLQFTNDSGTDYDLTLSGDTGIGSIASPTANGGKVLYFGDNAADPTMDTNTAGIYAKDVAGTVEMFAVDEADNATQISPHDPKTGEWRYYSKNLKTGVVKEVNMEKLVRLVERLSGEKLMNEWIE